MNIRQHAANIDHFIISPLAIVKLSGSLVSLLQQHLILLQLEPANHHSPEFTSFLGHKPL